MNTADRAAAAIAARHQHTTRLLTEVRHTVAQMRRENAPITAQGLARRAGVSRTFLYQNPQARRLLDEAINHTTTQREATHQAGRHRDELAAAWQQRALNAEDALTAANREIRHQRQHIAELMGQVRDLEHTWSQDGLQALVSENTTLKQHNRQLLADTQIVTDKLAAARSNARFLDRRIADLEVQLLGPTPAPITATERTEPPVGKGGTHH